MNLNRKSVLIFFRAQASSLMASVVDFGTLIIAVEVFKLWYMFGVVAGAILGGITSFTLGRYWSFKATRGNVSDQASRYFLVSAGSLVLNSAGVYLITEKLGGAYWVSKIITAFLVGVIYNFFMQKTFVFRKRAHEKAR